MRPINPHHPKSGPGKAQETAKAGKLAGRRSPHEPAQVKNSLCSHLFRGSLVLNGDIVVDQSESLTQAAFDTASQPSLTLAGVVVRN